MVIGVGVGRGRIEENVAGHEKVKEKRGQSVEWLIPLLKFAYALFRGKWKMFTNTYLEKDPPSFQDVNVPFDLRSTCMIYSSVDQDCPLWLYNYQLWCSLWNIMKYGHIKLKKSST